MTALEDRIAAALAARAELVQPEQLRPAPPPRTREPRHRRTAYLLTAAAVALVAGLPFVLSGDRDGSAPTTPAPDRTEPPTGDDPAWPVVRTVSLDLDGDGTDEEVRVRRGGGQLRLEADLSTGGSEASVGVRAPAIALRVLPADLEGDGSEELVVGEYLGRVAARVVLLEEGDLVLADRSAVAPLTTEFTRDGRVQDWWVADGRLFSTRSTEAHAVSDHYVPLPPEYAVEVWSWSVVDGALVPRELGTRCVREASPRRPYPC